MSPKYQNNIHTESIIVKELIWLRKQMVIKISNKNINIQKKSKKEYNLFRNYVRPI